MNTTVEKLQTISRLAEELILAHAPEPTSPELPALPRVTTAEQLRLALLKGGPIVIAAGTYGGNFGVLKPAVITEEQRGTVTLAPEDRFEPTLDIQASDVSVPALTIRNGAPDRTCVQVGNPEQTNAQLQPFRVLFDGTKIHAGATGGKRGLALHGSEIVVRNVDIRGFWYVGEDAQAIWINNGVGPYLVEGSHLEGSGENLLVGGDRLRIGQNPKNITIRKCVLFKPPDWRQRRSTVKNSIEFKAGEGILVEDNIFDGCWADMQAGNAIVLTPRNQEGDNPFTHVEDVVFRRNIVTNHSDGFAVNILGADDGTSSQRTQRITFEGNRFHGSPAGFLLQNAAGLRLVARRNTMTDIRLHFLSFSTAPLAYLEFVENVARTGDYGIHSPDWALGLGSIIGNALTYKFAGNVIEQGTERVIKYPTGNRILSPGDLASQLTADGRLVDGSAGW